MTLNEDPLGAARHLLAEIEAEVQGAEDELHRMLLDGVDHFHRKNQAALDRLDGTSLNTWRQEQQALSCVQERREVRPLRDAGHMGNGADSAPGDGE